MHANRPPLGPRGVHALPSPHMSLGRSCYSSDITQQLNTIAKRCMISALQVHRCASTARSDTLKLLQYADMSVRRRRLSAALVTCSAVERVSHLCGAAAPFHARCSEATRAVYCKPHQSQIHPTLNLRVHPERLENFFRSPAPATARRSPSLTCRLADRLYVCARFQHFLVMLPAGSAGVFSFRPYDVQFGSVMTTATGYREVEEGK